MVLERVKKLVRAFIAGAAATLVDLGTLALLVSVFHVNARIASIPALVLGGIANFLGNRHYAFRAAKGSFSRQAILYTIVEVMALAMNGLLYDTVLRAFPMLSGAYWLVRLATSHVVFLCWSYPLWNRVFRVKVPINDSLSIGSPPR
jgi:putative flippase GtrA